MKKAKEVVLEIVADIAGRRGIGNAWDEIDQDIQDEMIEEWTEIVNTNMTVRLSDRRKKFRGEIISSAYQRDSENPQVSDPSDPSDRAGLRDENGAQITDK